MLSSWTSDAKAILENSQKISLQAEEKLQKTSYQLNQRLPRRLHYSSTIFTSLKDHHRRCTALISLLESLPSLATSKIDTSLLTTLLQVISQLQATRVPEFVLSHHSNTPAQFPKHSRSTLADFISSDSIDLLKLNIERYESNYKKISNLVSSEYISSIKSSFSATVKTHAKILKLYNETMYDSPKVKHSQILKENTALEAELALILHLLTNHYDQCTLALSLQKSSTSSTLNLDILERDALELPEVAKEVQSIYDIIVNNDIRATELSNKRLVELQHLDESIEQQMEFYKLFKDTNITKYVTLHMAAEEMLQSQAALIGPQVETIELLIYHYKQFLSIYKKNYFLELHYEEYVYPRMFLSKLTKFLDEELAQVQKQERERRKIWLEKYGDFIPKEFRLPGEAEYPTVVQVITEGLDAARDEPDVERKLLDLISSL